MCHGMEEAAQQGRSLDDSILLQTTTHQDRAVLTSAVFRRSAVLKGLNVQPACRHFDRLFVRVIARLRSVDAKALFLRR